MKVNVGNFILDTETQMATLIGNFINDKYRYAARVNEWSALINFDYTFPTVIGTSTYTLPDDFETEIFVANITDGKKLEGFVEGAWFRERYFDYRSGSIDNGDPKNYIILYEANSIYLDPPPEAVKTIAMPYKKLVTALSGDNDTVAIKDLETYLEYAAIAEALAYKKQYQKAEYYRQKSLDELNERIAQERSRSNVAYQRIPVTSMGSKTGRLLGNGSYDTI